MGRRQCCCSVNPALRIKRLYSGDGFHSWTVEEFETYKKRHPSGTKARLALYLAMFTGLRREDLAIVCRQHVKSGWLTIRPGKTEKRTGVVVELPSCQYCKTRSTPARPAR
ncbi:hypothetical protein [Mesorhizobium wenxiniae]|uniref:hypothetical protein n=1 Tax=Mesorhizobium wenxiniae TaxID=2014805 RepID=UPI0010552A52|nr:hypothetical protein [Mesorhizobium wenxiniae]